MNDVLLLVTRTEQGIELNVSDAAVLKNLTAIVVAYALKHGVKLRDLLNAASSVQLGEAHTVPTPMVIQ